MRSAKDGHRQRLKTVRLRIAASERTIKNQQIVKRLKSLLDEPFSSLHYFEPIRTLGEIDITSLLPSLQENYPGLKLFTTRLIGDKWTLTSLQKAEIPSNFDVIVVPMLGFDKDLNRIGYGGGYYDKFLAAQPKAKKIGVCFEAGKVDKIPTEPHDIPLDMIVTEKAVYKR